jgi:hypothetical protein
MIESWVASTQNWMNARFADWDTRDPQTNDFVIVSDFYDAERLATSPQVQQASPGTPGPEQPTRSLTSFATSSTTTAPDSHREEGRVRPVSFQRKLRSFDPIEVMTSTEPSIVDLLNQRNEGIGVVPTPVLRRTATKRQFNPLVVMDDANLSFGVQLNLAGDAVGRRPAKLKESPVVRSAFQPIAVPADLYGGIAFTLNRENEGLGIKPAVAARHPAAIASFAPLEASPNLYFAGELRMASIAVTAKSAAIAAFSRPTASRPVSRNAGNRAPDTLEDLFIEVAGELAPANDGFGTIAGKSRFSAGATRPRFEPLEVGQDFQTGLAYELNRGHDGTRLPATSGIKAAKATSSMPLPPGDLTRAMELTREAVYAWYTVFTGPAIVTASQSN